MVDRVRTSSDHFVPTLRRAIRCPKFAQAQVFVLHNPMSTGQEGSEHSLITSTPLWETQRMPWWMRVSRDRSPTEAKRCSNPAIGRIKPASDGSPQGEHGKQSNDIEPPACRLVSRPMTPCAAASERRRS